MSVDVLQERIRKSKSPLLLSLQMQKGTVPPLYGQSLPEGFCAYGKALLSALRDTVAGILLPYGSFALWGQAGLEGMEQLRQYAQELGYYVICDLQGGYTGELARAWGEKVLLQQDFDAMTLCAYAGSDCIKPLTELTKEGKLLLVQVKTPNKSAVEIQDLICGGRLVHTAVAELASRCGQGPVGKFGYTQIGCLVSANSPRSIEGVRGKYRELFLVVTGLDATGGNAKNASLAFDRLGHGAAVCAGPEILQAWLEHPEGDPVQAAAESALRLKKNLLRYVTVL